MDGRRKQKCRGCGKRREPNETLSWEGYCATCGPMVRNQANDDMHYHHGHYFLRWRRGMAASVGGVLLDDVQETG